MAEEGRVSSLISISTKEEDLVESKKRWKEVFLRSTGGKECLLVVAKGAAQLFQYLIQQVRIFRNIQEKGSEFFLPLRCGRVRNVATL